MVYCFGAFLHFSTHYRSVGAGLIEESRDKFDAFIKRIAHLPENPKDDGDGVQPGEIPVEQPTLYEYYFDVDVGRWVPWASVSVNTMHEYDDCWMRLSARVSMTIFNLSCT